jgi:DNA invertase Pin-like site-specific DNA recombinase
MDDALAVLGKLKERGISLYMIDLGGDTTGNGVSKLVFTILSVVAEAERDRTRRTDTRAEARPAQSSPVSRRQCHWARG